MTDDDVRRRVDALVPSTDDIDVETALTRTRATARIHARRRRLALRVAPLAVAAATVAIVLLATVGPLHKTGTPTAKRPSPSPTSATAWFRHVAGTSSAASGSVDLSSIWVVRLTDANNGTFDVRPSARFGAGTLHYDGSQGGWVVDVLGGFCHHQPGVYHVTKSGQSLVFTVVRDTCEPRRDVLGDTVFEPLTSPDQLIG